MRSAVGETKKHAAAWGYLAARGSGAFKNFGDEVSPLVVEAVSGQEVRWSKLGNAELVAVGSLLNEVARVGADVRVFGSGVRTPEGLAAVLAPESILSVRGGLTRAELKLDSGIPSGDPGLYVRELLRGPATVGKTGLVVPHFAVPQTRRGRAVLSALRAQGWSIGLPNMDPLEMAKEIQRANLVVTSSLHAMVFAHSVGTPVQLTTFDATGPAEPLFKYDDYLSVFGLRARLMPIAELAEQSPAVLVTSLAAETEQVRGRVDSVIEAIYEAASPLRSRN